MQLEELKQLLIVALIISGASLGVRCITSPGMIFYFLIQPFDKITDRKRRLLSDIGKIEDKKAYYKDLHSKGDISYDQLKNKQALLDTALVLMDNTHKYEWLSYIMKPILMCGTCMASVHTLIWWPVLIGDYTWSTVAVMLVVAFVNTIVYSLIELINKHL